MIPKWNCCFIRCAFHVLFLFTTLIAQAQFPGGTGTVADPFRISTLEDLRTLSENDEYWDDHFILANDIDATDTRNWNVVDNNAMGFSPIGNRTSFDNPFTGSFDGQGYAISNLYINRGFDLFVGFFGRTDGATIESLGLEDCNVRGSSDTGGLIGLSHQSLVRNCYVTGTVESIHALAGGLIGILDAGTLTSCYTRTQVSAGQMVGGVVGFTIQSEVNNSFTFGQVTATLGDGAGGFTGLAISSNISNSYAEVRVAAGTSSGAFISFNNESQVINCYFNEEVASVGDAIFNDDFNQAVTSLTGAGFADQSIFENAGWDFQYMWELNTLPAFAATNRPYLRHQLYDHRVKVISLPAQAVASIAGQSFYNSGDPVTLEIQPAPGFTFLGWEEDGTIVSTDNPYNFTCTGNTTYTALFKENVPFSGGIGTESDPYQITSIEQLQSINDMPTLLARHYVLTADIDASSTLHWNGGTGFDPIASDHPTEGQRVFTGTINGQGHRIENLYINRPGQDKVGLIAETDRAKITDLGLYDAEIHGNDTVGALVAYHKGFQNVTFRSISRCYVSGRVNGHNFTGGLVGVAENANLSHCYSTAWAVGNSEVGGLVGYLKGIRHSPRILESYAAGPVLALGNLGALVSTLDGASISNSVYDRQTSLLDKGTNTGDRSGITPLGTTLFVDTFYIQALGGLDLRTNWKLAYTHDGFLRPVLPWENTSQVTFVSGTGGSLNGDSTQLVVQARNSAPMRAVADSNAVFTGWERDKVIISTDNPLRVAARDTDQTIKALFTPRAGSYQATFRLAGAVISDPNAVLYLDHTAYKVNTNGEVIITHLDNGTYTYKVSIPPFKAVEGSITINNADVTEVITLEGGPIMAYATTFSVKKGPQPVENALVGVINANVPPGTIFQTTNALGRTVFAGLPFGNYSYFVAANALDTTYGEFLVSPGEATLVDISMVATYSATLRVFDGTSPISDGTVLFDDNIVHDLSTGDFSQDLLLPGTYSYKITAHGYLDEEGSITIADQDVNEVITLSPQPVPVSRAKFNVTDGSNPAIPGVLSLGGQLYRIDDKGQAEVVNLEPGRYPYRIGVWNFRPYTDTLEIINADIVENVIMISNASAPRYDVTFIITDGTDPVKEALLSIDRRFYSLTAADNGRVTVTGLFVDTDYPYLVSSSEYQVHRGTVGFNGADVVESIVMVPVVPAYSVKFKVTDGTSPLASASINFEGKEYFTDAAGELSIPGVANGTYSYSVSLENYASINSSVTVNDADEIEKVTLTAVSPPTYSLTFWVTGGTSALPNVLINLDGAEYRSDVLGEVLVTGLVDGIYHYTISKEGFETVSGSVILSGEDKIENVIMSLVVLPTYSLTFRVGDEAGPLANASVSFEGSDYFTDATGEVLVTGLSSGTYSYTISLENYKTLNASVTIQNSDKVEDVNMEAHLPTAYTISFFVISNEQPLENARISLAGNNYFTNGQGRLEIGGLDAGSYEYLVFKEGYEPETSTVTLTDQDMKVSVKMTAIILSVDDPLEKAIHVYPVPAEDFIVLGGLQTSKVYSVSLHDVQGKQQVLFEDQVSSGFKIDVSRFRAGLFILVITDEDGNQWTRQVSKR